MEPLQVNRPEDFDNAVKKAILSYIKKYKDPFQAFAIGKLLKSIKIEANDICKVNILVYSNTEKALQKVIESIIAGIYNNFSLREIYEIDITISSKLSSHINCNNNVLDLTVNTSYIRSINCVFTNDSYSIPLSDVYFEYRLSKKMQLIKCVIKRLQKDINKNYMYTKSNKDDIFDNFHKASHILSYSDLCDSYVLRKFRCILKEYLNLLSKYGNDEEMLAKIEEEFKKSNIILEFNPEVTLLDAIFKYDKDNKQSEITYIVYSMND